MDSSGAFGAYGFESSVDAGEFYHGDFFGAVWFRGSGAGASGAVLAFAACAPQACQEIYTAWKENDPRLAAEKQQRVTEASMVVAGKFGISGIKHACDLNGYYGGRPRVPLLPLNGEAQTLVAQLMADIRH